MFNCKVVMLSFTEDLGNFSILFGESIMKVNPVSGGPLLEF